MRAAIDAPHLPTMNTERGREIGRRFEALDISDREWHKRTGIDRKTLQRAIEGLVTVRGSTYDAIEANLDKLEARLRGVAQPGEARPIGEDYIEIDINGVFGVESIVVKGRPEDSAELAKMVAELLRDMRENPGPQQ